MLSISRTSLRSLASLRASSTTLKSIPSIRLFSSLTLSSSASLRPTSSFKSLLLQSAVQTSNYATSTTAPSSTFDPTDTVAQEFLDMGNKALEDQDLKSAGRAYEESLLIKDTAIGNYNLGVVRYTEKNLPAAIKAFLHCITLAPVEPARASLAENTDPTPPLTQTQILLSDANLNLGGCYIMDSPPRPDLALFHLQQALEINPDDPEVVFNLAAILEATGDDTASLEEALVAYERAVTLGVESAKVNIKSLSAKIEARKLKEEAEEKAIGAKSTKKVE